MCKVYFPLAIVYIISVEFCERLCYYTFLGTQKTFLQDQGYNNAQSSSINLAWSSMSYVACFFGGWLASTKFGIFNTIAALAFMYAMGTFVGAIAALPAVQESGYAVSIYLFAVFVLVAIGCGGIKPNVPTMGANQFEPHQEEERASFFVYFYLSINMGSIISHAFLSSWATSGVPGLGVTIEYGYLFAWSIAGTFMFLAFLVFVAGKKKYRMPLKDKQADDEQGIVTILFTTLVQGRSTWQGTMSIVGWAAMPLFVVISITNAFVNNSVLQIISSALALLCVVFLIVAHVDNSWLPDSNVSKALDVIPMILIGNVGYGILMSAVGSVFQSEACQMDTRRNKEDFSYEGFQYTGDFFRLANPIGVIIGAPLLDKVVYKAVKNLRGNKKEVSVACKVVSGYMLGIAAQLIAAMLEYQRKAAPVLDIQSHCAPYIKGTHDHVKMSDFNANWMFIPYALVGVGEIMVNPVLQFIAYEGSPPEVKPLMQAFNLFSSGALGNGIASVINQQLKSLVPNDLNEGDLPMFYYVNSAIGIAGIVLFLIAYCMAPERVKRLGDKSGEEKLSSTEEDTDSDWSETIR